MMYASSITSNIGLSQLQKSLHEINYFFAEVIIFCQQFDEQILESDPVVINDDYVEKKKIMQILTFDLDFNLSSNVLEDKLCQKMAQGN